MKFIYSIQDSKAEAFTQPFFAATDNLAKRMVIMSMLDPENSLRVFAADYTLFALGFFDEHTGQITPHEAATNLGNLLTFMPLLDQYKIQAVTDNDTIIPLDEKKEAI